MATKHDIEQEVGAEALKALLDDVTHALASRGKRVIRGFGTFKVREREGFTDYVDDTEMSVPGIRMAVFQPDQGFGDTLQGALPMKKLPRVAGAIAARLLAGEGVDLGDFGRFEVTVRQGFQGHNPRTGKPVDIARRVIPVFRTGEGLRASLGAPAPTPAPRLPTPPKGWNSLIGDQFAVEWEALDVLVDDWAQRLLAAVAELSGPRGLSLNEPVPDHKNIRWPAWRARLAAHAATPEATLVDHEAAAALDQVVKGGIEGVYGSDYHWVCTLGDALALALGTTKEGVIGWSLAERKRQIAAMDRLK